MFNNKGTVIQVMGPVLDIRFADDCLPQLLNAIEIPNGDNTFQMWSRADIKKLMLFGRSSICSHLSYSLLPIPLKNRTQHLQRFGIHRKK